MLVSGYRHYLGRQGQGQAMLVSGAVGRMTKQVIPFPMIL
jgi:hypothetical protein